MPYISRELRDELDFVVTPLVDLAEKLHPGALNYTITRILLGRLGNAPSYKDLNEVLGVLEAVKLELYRREISPYEDKKCQENGDVY